MKFEHAVEIAATPDLVWDVLIDIAGWPEWTDSVTTVERLDTGPLGVGSRARLKQPRLPVAVWEVTELEPGRSFTWVSHSALVTTTGEHVVMPVGGTSSGSLVRLVITQEGAMAGLAGRLAGSLTRRYLEMEAQGLKRRAEGFATP